MDTIRHAIYFHGTLGSSFGTGPYFVYADTIQEIFKGLTSRFGDTFKDTIVAGNWHILPGTRTTNQSIIESDSSIDTIEVELPCQHEVLNVYPAITGAGAVARIIIGVVLIIVGVLLYAYGGGFLAKVGLSVAFAGISTVAGGVVQLLTKTPNLVDYSGLGQSDRRQSFLFNGGVNQVEQGGPCPVLYGNFLIGSTIINGSIHVDQLL